MKYLAILMLATLSASCAFNSHNSLTQDGAFMPSSAANSESIKNLAPFPKTKEGFQRYVIHLNPNIQAESYLVELIVGKTESVDCNIHRLNGNIAEKDLVGWGYTYYEFTTQGQMVSTMMACPDHPKIEKFITAATKQVRYNSRLPIVVFVQNGYELKYRLWKAQDVLPATLD